MPKIMIAPDSFKGTLSAKEVCDVMKDAVLSVLPQAETECLPLADGGEGTARIMTEAMGGEMGTRAVAGPFGDPVSAAYGMAGDTAIIEMAQAAGLPLCDRKDVKAASTFGVGQMILHAAHHGARKALICLGGSATNDGGCGMAAAVGVRFLDKNGNSFVPTGGTLCDIQKIDLREADPDVQAMSFTVVSDVTNPLFGENGAAFVFAPQKGADEDTVRLLDDGLRHFAKILLRDTGFDVSSLPGGGAAGGMGAGCVAFFNAVIRSGIDTVLETLDFERRAADADLIFTGEGKLDAQTMGGKVVSGVLARRGNTPVIAVVGGYEGDERLLFEKGLTAVFSINTLPQTLAEGAGTHAARLGVTTRNILRTFFHSDIRN